MNFKKIKILIADDHKLMREAIISCLAPNDNLEIVGEAIDGEEAIQKAEELQPDIILLDIRMPKIDGIQAAKIIKRKNSEIKIIIISGLREEEYISESIKAGATGYIIKDSISINIETAINTVLNNGTYLDERISRFLLDEYIRKLKSADNSIDSSGKRNNISKSVKKLPSI